jgi:hypothetical protein
LLYFCKGPAGWIESGYFACEGGRALIASPNIEEIP